MNTVKNKGVLLGDAPDTYRAGRVGGALPFVETILSGNWEPWLPPGEWQKSDNGDSMSCVTFGEENGVETQELQQTGQQVNYSDRWIAKMSNTTREGNYLYKVADAIRKYGLVLESSYPAPVTYTWEEYHADIPEPLLSRLLAEGQAWLKKWDVKYESVDTSRDSLLRHIKHAPLVVVLPGHLVLNWYTTKDVIYYFDSYAPWKKTTNSVLQAMKVVLYKKEVAIPDEALLVDIKYLDGGKQVEKLKNALHKLGWMPDTSKYQGYDQKLANLVLNFQKANLPHASWAYFWAVFFDRGRVVDQATRDIINMLLSRKGV